MTFKDNTKYLTKVWKIFQLSLNFLNYFLMFFAEK